MIKSVFLKKIRNFFDFYPSPFLINFKNKNISISDGFVWRTDEGYSTVFNYSDLLFQFFNDNSSKIELLFFDRNGKFLKHIEKNELSNTHKINISSKFMNNISDYGSFYIFHNTNKNFNSIIRNSCYTGYSKYKNIPSYVHGNICSASKDLKTNKINFNLMGKSFFKKKKYIVQNYFNFNKTEIMLINPTDKKINIKVNKKDLTIDKKATKLIEIDSVKIEIESNLYLIRPIVFNYKGEYLDVMHG